MRIVAKCIFLQKKNKTSGSITFISSRYRCAFSWSETKFSISNVFFSQYLLAAADSGSMYSTINIFTSIILCFILNLRLRTTTLMCDSRWYIIIYTIRDSLSFSTITYRWFPTSSCVQVGGNWIWIDVNSIAKNSKLKSTTMQWMWARPMLCIIDAK